MLRENNVFLTERMEYQSLVDTRGVYLLGTFVPAENDKVNNNFVQMIPTDNTKLMFDTVRRQLGYIPFDDSYSQDPTVYTSSGKTSVAIINKFYNIDTHITNMSTEFLDNVGIYLGVHSIRLVELTETNDTYYYVLVGGKGALEAKADETYNAKDTTLYDGEPFWRNDDGIALNSMSLVYLAMTMANDAFSRNWQKEDPKHAENTCGVNTPHSFDMGEIDKWTAIDEYKNWTDASRIGIAFAIKK